MLTPGAEDCTVINGPVTRRVCPEVAKLRAELGRAQRRTELQRTLAKAQSTMTAAPAVTEPDPLASALAVYLFALGWDVKSGTLAPWLYLIPVLFLGFGPALGVVLVRAVLVNETASDVEQKGENRTVGPPSVQGVQIPAAKDAKTLESQAFGGVQGSVPAIQANTDDDDDDDAPGGRLGTRLLRHLGQQGGSINSGQRGLAKMLGTSKSTLHNTLHELAVAGVVTVDTTRRGTVVALVAAH